MYVGEIVGVEPKELSHGQFCCSAVAIVFDGVFGVTAEEALVFGAFSFLPSASGVPAVPDGAENRRSNPWWCVL